MKVCKLLHNPGAGDEEHSKEALLAQVKASGFDCRYTSTKSDWQDIEPDVEFLIAAGGDGTVRKITKKLLDRKVLDKTWPLGLLPLGTANNIAKTLGLNNRSTEEIITSWHHKKIKKYDVGKIVAEDKTRFFLEGFGYGVFPYLMLEMHKIKHKVEGTPEEMIQTALAMLYKIVQSYKPRVCQLQVDGVDYSGTFLLAEIMNICSIGPNLFLSPDSDPGDGILEIVLVPEEDKDKFVNYVTNRLNGVDETFVFQTLKGKQVNISWEGTHVHVDDETFKISKAAPVQIELVRGVLEFLVP